MPLDRQVILHHAFLVLNEAGLENLTLRRLAARLGVQAPAIYWHFKNKQDLLDEMATRVFQEAMAEAPAMDRTQSWQDWAVAYGTGLRRTLLRYRDGARMFSGTYITDTSLYAPMDASLRKLTTAGFSLRDAVVGMSTLYNFTVGFVIEEQAVTRPPGNSAPDGGDSKLAARYDLSVRDRRVDKELYPLAWAAGAEMFLDQDRGFQSGLAVVVAGMATLLPESHASV